MSILPLGWWIFGIIAVGFSGYQTFGKPEHRFLDRRVAAFLLCVYGGGMLVAIIVNYMRAHP